MDIRQIQITDSPLLANFYRNNKEHLTPWEPQRKHSLLAWQDRTKQRVEEAKQQKAAFFIALNSQTGKIQAICNLTNIVREPFHACYMGFAVDKDQEGTGLMFELCTHVIDYAFNEMLLNRIMANYLPTNLRSKKLLSKLGFE
tara:strand:+ start:341 stop:769 length:429 start_codon:yes stop_codon:yes gene_type:complete